LPAFKLGSALKTERAVLEMLGELEEEAGSAQLKQQLRHHADATCRQIETSSRRSRRSVSRPTTNRADRALDKVSRANVKIADERMVDAVILAGAAATRASRDRGL
jgi:ferritin-like metal-binding protein YciE